MLCNHVILCSFAVIARFRTRSPSEWKHPTSSPISRLLAKYIIGPPFEKSAICRNWAQKDAIWKHQQIVAKSGSFDAIGKRARKNQISYYGQKWSQYHVASNRWYWSCLFSGSYSKSTLITSLFLSRINIILNRISCISDTFVLTFSICWLVIQEMKRIINYFNIFLR